jgi:rhamnose transport system substrate-binding protein
MKAKLLATTAAAIVALAFAAEGANAASRWDGADDLPTSPLACDASPAAAGAAKPYDGGQPTNPPDKAGKEITLVDVPKLIGIGYFNATSKGMQDAAKELGNVKVTTDGPTEAKIDEQIKFIDNYITRGVDGVLFAANDPVAIAPVLKKALSKGIHVVGYDANSTPDAREWFVNQTQFNGFAKAMMDSMAKDMGEDGSFAIVTSTFTTPNQSR